jgi:hypothetical protein
MVGNQWQYSVCHLQISTSTLHSSCVGSQLNSLLLLNCTVCSAFVYKTSAFTRPVGAIDGAQASIITSRGFNITEERMRFSTGIYPRGMQFLYAFQ